MTIQKEVSKDQDAKTSREDLPKELRGTICQSKENECNLWNKGEVHETGRKKKKVDLYQNKRNRNIKREIFMILQRLKKKKISRSSCYENITTP